MRAKREAQISIHAPTRGATEAGRCAGKPYKISIHAPTRGATGPGKPRAWVPFISIHAPTRGATTQTVTETKETTKFQSTLLQEERLKKSINLFEIRRFQSTLLQEERPFPVCRVRVLHHISIHAPTRGATCAGHMDKAQACKFQSTLLQEERPQKRCGTGKTYGFQSTLLQEERLEE